MAARSVQARATAAPTFRHASGGWQRSDESRTATVILRNIACKYTQIAVKGFLDECGLRGKFSLIYLPRVEARKCNLGYVFVCFRTPEYADECYRLLHGRVFGDSRTDKLCRVELADLQGGAEALLNRKRRKQNGQAPAVLVCNDPLPQVQRRGVAQTVSEWHGTHAPLPEVQRRGVAQSVSEWHGTHAARSPLAAELWAFDVKPSFHQQEGATSMATTASYLPTAKLFVDEDPEILDCGASSTTRESTPTRSRRRSSSFSGLSDGVLPLWPQQEQVRVLWRMSF